MADKTVRERILAQLEKNMSALRGDGGAKIFAKVDRAPLDKSDFSGDYACAVIDEGEGVAVYEVGYLEMDMTVTLEVWARIKQGTQPAAKLNELIGVVTKRFLMDYNTIEDKTNKQLTLNVKQGSLVFDIDGVNDHYVAAYRQFVLTYRTGKQDPYDLR